MTERDTGVRANRRLWSWVMRLSLAGGILYSALAASFYGWYADFPGPNQSKATVVATIWSIVAVACIAALVASLFRNAHRSSRNDD
jgi:hypothetical protein